MMKLHAVDDSSDGKAARKNPSLLEEFAMNEGKSFVTKVYFFNID
jgi:hypothetical protein